MLLGSVLKTKMPLILTIVASLGVGATAYMAVRDSRNKKKSETEPENKLDEAKEFGKTYWKTMAVGSLTIGCIAGSHILSAKQILALTGAMGVLSKEVKDIQKYLKKNYPEEYDKMMKEITKPSKKEFVKEETYDGRTKYYEPVSEQFFFAKPEQVKELECFINKSIINDFAIPFDFYLEELQKIDKNIKVYPWAKKLGWAYDDETFCYNMSYSEDGAWIGLHPEMTDVGDDVAHYIRYSIFPYEIEDTLQDLYA